jgi:hypothetical protein
MMDMKTYRCMNPDENPFLHWGEHRMKEPAEKEEDLVRKFKNDPDSFFQPMIPTIKRRIK